MKNVVSAASAIALAACLFAGDGFHDLESYTHKPVRTGIRFIATPLTFEPNVGQSDSSARFIAHGSGYSVQLQPSSIRFRVSGSRSVIMDLIDARRNAWMSGEDLLPGKANYFPTSDRKTWRANILTFSKVRSSLVYPGVDAVYHGNALGFEYDFLIRPNGNPGQIRMKLSGGDGVRVANNGDLVLRLGGGDLRFFRPVAYQTANDGRREEVAATYQVQRGAEVSFALGRYDHSRALVIDPVVGVETPQTSSPPPGEALLWSEYIGADAWSVAVDNSGNTWVTGTTPLNDVGLGGNGFYVTELNSRGAVVYTTIIGTGTIYPARIAVDGSGRAYVVGTTMYGGTGAPAPTLPTASNSYMPSAEASTNAFFVQISADGASVPYATFLGAAFAPPPGTNPSGAYGLAVDSNGNSYIAGSAGDATFPVTPGVYEVAPPPGSFLARIDPAASGSASLVYSTILGDLTIKALAIDTAGNAYVTGSAPNGYPITPGAFQYSGNGSENGGIYVTKLNSTATGLVYSAYLGEGQGAGIAVDGSGAAYITGTASSNFPTTSGAYQTSYAGTANPGVFITSLSADGSTELYSTFLDGSGNPPGVYSIPSDIALPNGCGSGCNAYITGYTTRPDFPVVNAFQAVPDKAGSTGPAGFVAELAADGGSALLSSYVGGFYWLTWPLNTGRGPSLAVDSAGNMSVAGSFQGLPITISADNTPNSPGLLAKIGPSAEPYLAALPNGVKFGNQPTGVSTASSGGTATVRLQNASSISATLQSIEVAPGSFSESDNCNGVVSAGGYCTLTLDFTPAAPGPTAGAITVTSNASDSPFVIALSGTGVTNGGGTQPGAPATTVACQGTNDSPALQAAATNAGHITVTGGCTLTSHLTLYSNTIIDWSAATVSYNPPRADYMIGNYQNAQVPNRSFADAVTTAGSQTLTSATAEFMNADVGQSVACAGAYGSGFFPNQTGWVTTTFNTTIQSVTNVNTAVLTDAPLVSLNPTTCTILYRDHDIAMIGGKFYMGGPYVTSSSNETFQFVSINNLTIDGVTTYDGLNGQFQSTSVAGKQIMVMDATNFSLSNITLNSWYQLQDGIDITGPARNGLLTGIGGHTGDDMIAISPLGPAFKIPGLTATQGVVQGIVIDGESGSSVYAGVKLFGPSGNSLPILDLTVRHVHGLPGTPPGYVWYQADTLGGYQNGVTMINGTGDNFLFDDVGGAISGNVVNMSSDAGGSITVGTLTVQNPSSTYSPFNPNSIINVHGASFTNLSIDGFKSEADNLGNWIYFSPDGTDTVTHMAVSGIEGSDISGGRVLPVTLNGTFGDISFSDWSLNYNTSFSAGYSGIITAQNATIGSIGLSRFHVTHETGSLSGGTLLWLGNYSGNQSTVGTIVYQDVSYTAPAVLPTTYLLLANQQTKSPQSFQMSDSVATNITGCAYPPSVIASTLGVNNQANVTTPSTCQLGAQVQPPVVSMSPSSIVFGNQNVGSASAAQNVVISNTGQAALAITGIAVNGAGAAEFVQTNNCPGMLGANSTCAVSLAFKPTVAGSGSATLLIADNNNGIAGSAQSVGLTGTGVLSLAALSPKSVAFSSGVGASSVVTLRNTGNAPLAIAEIGIAGADPGDFAQTNNCPTTIAAGASCGISVSFTPTTSGTRCATFTVIDNSGNVAGSTQTVSLTGQSTEPNASVSTTSVPFGSQNLTTPGTAPNATSVTSKVTLSNTGNAPLAVSAIGISGTNAIEFTQTNKCPSSLAPGASCTICVTFTPTPGSASATLVITDNSGGIAGTTQQISLSGTGIPIPVFSLSPSRFVFANQNVGSTSAAQTFTLGNTGQAGLAITNIGLSGSSTAEFAQINNCPAILAAGSACTVSVTFTPNAIGTAAATLSITDNNNGIAGSKQSASLCGTGIAPNAGLSPASLSFSNQNVGSPSAVQTVTLRNSGNAPLTITAIAFAGANTGDYGETDNCAGGIFPATLAALGTCTVNITFTPAAPGGRAATLVVTDNRMWVAGKTQSVSLSGTGLGPKAAVTPPCLTFSALTVGKTSLAQTVTLSNGGSATLSVASIALGGANPGDFAMTTACGATLAAKATCTVSIKFAPATTGSRSADLLITDNANNAPAAVQDVPLSGTGK